VSAPFRTGFAVSTPDETSIVADRAFAASPDRVWRVMTEPEHMRQWLGSPDFPLTTCEMDVRVDGEYRWVFGDPGSDHTMGVSGAFREVERPGLLVSTEEFDDFPGPSTNTLVLTGREDGTTAMTLTVRYPDQATRDGWVASGMTTGLSAGYDRLDTLLGEA
jgi:uncharacterized protein YndB with AHSA1/START domain